MTIAEHRVHGAAMNNSGSFNPFEEFDGVWTTELASYYASEFSHMFGKWECVDGRLVVAPFEAADNSWGEAQLVRILGNQARAAGFFVLGCLNAALAPGTWLQPDVCVLSRLPSEEDLLFVPIDHFAMPVEFVSRSNRRRDRVDKPRLLAKAGVPYFMTVELDGRRRTIVVEQSKLVDERYEVISSATTGGVFTMNEPFDVTFSVDDLLFPRS